MFPFLAFALQGPANWLSPRYLVLQITDKRCISDNKLFIGEKYMYLPRFLAGVLGAHNRIIALKEMTIIKLKPWIFAWFLPSRVANDCLLRCSRRSLSQAYAVKYVIMRPSLSDPRPWTYRVSFSNKDHLVLFYQGCTSHRWGLMG